MTHKQIETMREIRLWAGQVIIPVSAMVITALNIPEVRQAVGQKVTEMKAAVLKKKKN